MSKGNIVENLVPIFFAVVVFSSVVLLGIDAVRKDQAVKATIENKQQLGPHELLPPSGNGGGGETLSKGDGEASAGGSYSATPVLHASVGGRLSTYPLDNVEPGSAFATASFESLKLMADQQLGTYDEAALYGFWQAREVQIKFESVLLQHWRCRALGAVEDEEPCLYPGSEHCYETLSRMCAEFWNLDPVLGEQYLNQRKE